MKRSLPIPLLLLLLLLVGGEAHGQAGRFIRAPHPDIPAPRPGGGGVGGPNVGVPGRHGGEGRDWGWALLVILGVIVGLVGTGAAGWHLGKYLGGRQATQAATSKFSTTENDSSFPDYGIGIGTPGGPSNFSTTEKGSSFDPDRILDPVLVMAKARPTKRLLEFLAHRDSTLNPVFLDQWISQTFYRVQGCWQERDYTRVHDLILPGLLAEHENLLQQMRASHESNRLEGLKIQGLEFVHLCCPENPDKHELSALITFQAASYYVDDRTGKCRGPRHARRFQEFWTFRRQGENWRLQAIERTHHSARLEAANYVVDLSEEQLRNAQECVAL